MSNFIYILKCDLARITKPSLWGALKSYFFPRGDLFRYIFWFRLMQYVKGNKISRIIFGFPIYLIYRHYEYKYGIHINTNMEIGEGLLIKHGDGVYLNCKRIGRNFTVFQGVTLGINKDGIPLVEDNVTVFTNAVVVGEIILHSNSKVGANAFVNKDVNENVTVVGNPAREIQ